MPEIRRITDDSEVLAFLVTPDGKTVVYESTIHRQLYSVPIDGSEDPVRLTDPQPLVPGVRPAGFAAITPDGSRVVFVGEQEETGRPHVYSVPIDGSAEAIRLSGPLDSGFAAFGEAFRIASDSTTVVYPFHPSSSASYEAYSAPVDGATEAIPLGTGPIIEASLRLSG